MWSDVTCIVHSCASVSLPSCYPSNILVADIPKSLVERKGFMHTLGRGSYSSHCPSFFCCFLTAKETQLKSLSSSGSAPAWALFLVWQWNGTFRFCFMHFLFLPKIYIRPRNLFFFCSHSFFFHTLVIFACLWFPILLSCPRFLSLWLIFSGLQKQKIRQNLKGKKRAV